MSTNASSFKFDSAERVLAALAAAAGLIVTVWAWLSVSRDQAVWPLPGLDLIEVTALTLLGAWGLWQASDAASLLAWAASGALLGFAILDGSSVGLFYLPVMALLMLGGLWRDRQAWQWLPLHICVVLVAAWAQATIIIILARVFAPNALS